MGRKKKQQDPEQAYAGLRERPEEDSPCGFPKDAENEDAEFDEADRSWMYQYGRGGYDGDSGWEDGTNQALWCDTEAQEEKKDTDGSEPSFPSLKNEKACISAASWFRSMSENGMSETEERYVELMISALPAFFFNRDFRSRRHSEKCEDALRMIMRRIGERLYEKVPCSELLPKQDREVLWHRAEKAEGKPEWAIAKVEVGKDGAFFAAGEGVAVYDFWCDLPFSGEGK